MGKVFALIPNQKKLIDRYCEECGNILVGTLVDEEIGEMLPCKTEECPYEEGRFELGECMDGIVWIRKLRGDIAAEMEVSDVP